MKLSMKRTRSETLPLMANDDGQTSAAAAASLLLLASTLGQEKHSEIEWPNKFDIATQNFLLITIDLISKLSSKATPLILAVNHENIMTNSGYVFTVHSSSSLASSIPPP